MEDEKYRCEKCEKVFSMRIQDSGIFDFDEGTGRCEKCYKCLCEKCGDWHTYGDRYAKLCKTCFNDEMLCDFFEWYDIFENEYCERNKGNCDECPFFFKKGCMMMFLKGLTNEAFYTEELKQADIERLQKKNRLAEREWEKQLKEAIEKGKKAMKESNVPQARRFPAD